MRFRTALLALVSITALAGAGLWLTAPQGVAKESLPANHVPDLANGEKIYHIGGCISCHRPTEESGRDRTLPSGGAPLVTPIGTFYPPNLTPDAETGIGRWSDAEFVSAVQRGVSPRGDHYIPAFPYTSYNRMRVEDVLDLKAYLDSLPAVAAPRREPDVRFAWFIRRAMGVWDRMALTGPFKADPTQSEAWNRGAYLVNGPGHCGECHTPRTALMMADASRTFAGGPHPEGHGKVPSLRGLVARGEFTDAADLKNALQTGEEGGYDQLASGGMSEVQGNISKLPDADVAAIAEYLTSLE